MPLVILQWARPHRKQEPAASPVAASEPEPREKKGREYIKVARSAHEPVGLEPHLRLRGLRPSFYALHRASARAASPPLELDRRQGGRDLYRERGPYQTIIGEIQREVEHVARLDTLYHGCGHGGGGESFTGSCDISSHGDPGGIPGYSSQPAGAVCDAENDQQWPGARGIELDLPRGPGCLRRTPWKVWRLRP